MNRIICYSVILIFVFINFSCSQQPDPASQRASFKEPELDAVHWTGGFWKERFDHLQHTLLPGTIDGSCLVDGNGSNLNNFRRAAGMDDTPYARAVSWGEGDLYYILEAMCRVYALTKDPEIDAKLDYWIDIIGKIQQPDGYIGSRESLGVEERWSTRSAADYNMGHLLQAAIIHERATGKQSFMNIAKKVIDALYAHYEKHSKYSDDPRTMNFSMIFDVINFYRYTGDKRCLEIAHWNINNKGIVDHYEGGLDHWQSGAPLRDEIEGVGHGTGLPWTFIATTKMYDITKEQALLDVSTRIWEDVHATKYHVHGGYGGNPDPGLYKSPMRVIKGVTYGGHPTHEGYGPSYKLYNTFTNSECCGNFFVGMWSYELFRQTGDPKYFDAIERIFYNALMGAIDLDEAKWFYTTPNERRPTDSFNSDRTHDRWYIRNGFCCPPNLMRSIIFTTQWAYSINKEGIWVNIYGDNQLNSSLTDGTPVQITQKSNYPWDGNISIQIDQADAAFDLRLRIPEWVDENVEVKVNDIPVKETAIPGTYFKINRNWKAGDIISFELPVRVRMVETHPEVTSNRNRIAIFRGPILYVLEQFDLPEGISIDDIILPGDISFSLKEEDWPMLKQVRVLEGQAVLKSTVPEADTPPLDYSGWEGKLYRKFSGQTKDLTGSTPVTIKLIPYFTWANREEPYILCWFPVPGAEPVIEPPAPTGRNH